MSFENIKPINIKINCIDNDFKLMPIYSTEGSVGMDLKSAKNLVLEPKIYEIIPTGISIELYDNIEAQIRSRSGLAAKFGICVLNSPGTIDVDYRGEIQVILINHGNQYFIINKYDRIAQMVFSRVEKVDFSFKKLNTTNRNENGLGSTGVT